MLRHSAGAVLPVITSSSHAAAHLGDRVLEHHVSIIFCMSIVLINENPGHEINQYQIIVTLQFQQAQVDDFCQRNDLNFKKLSKLGRHILIDKRSKTAFCFAPKVGCTNLKILFFITQGNNMITYIRMTSHPLQNQFI